MNNNKITEGDFYDPCDFCPWYSLTTNGLRIHFGMVHAKYQCKDGEHQYDSVGYCTKKNCGMRRKWEAI